MNNEEKAQEIVNKFIPNDDFDTAMKYDLAKIALLHMAQWKDEQFNEQKKLTWKEVKYIIELDGDIETDNFMGSDEYYQAVADKANVVLFGLQGKLDD